MPAAVPQARHPAHAYQPAGAHQDRHHGQYDRQQGRNDEPRAPRSYAQASRAAPQAAHAAPSAPTKLEFKEDFDFESMLGQMRINANESTPAELPEAVS